MGKGEQSPHELPKETRERVSSNAAALRREREKDANIQFLYALYRGKWERSGGHADPATFKDVSPGVLKWAQDADREMKRRLEDPGNTAVMRGTALELFLGVEIEEQKWFGGEVVRVAAVDDFANSLDLAIEWERDEELGVVPRLAVDFTTSERDDVLDKKLKKLSEGTSVNFFRSKAESFEGRVNDLPMVILGVNADVLSEAAERLVSGSRVDHDYPLKEILLRQAAIQVGLQIRKLGANLAAGAFDRTSRRPAARTAIGAYVDGLRNNPNFTRDMTHAVEILCAIPEEEMRYYLQSKHKVTRLRTLLAVHKRLAVQLASIEQSHPETERIAASLKLTMKLERKDA
jgi:hypothetical protein